MSAKTSRPDEVLFESYGLHHASRPAGSHLSLVSSQVLSARRSKVMVNIRQPCAQTWWRHRVMPNIPVSDSTCIGLLFVGRTAPRLHVHIGPRSGHGVQNGQDERGRAHPWTLQLARFHQTEQYVLCSLRAQAKRHATLHHCVCVCKCNSNCTPCHSLGSHVSG